MSSLAGSKISAI